jgi:ATP-dependent Lon protease
LVLNVNKINAFIKRENLPIKKISCSGKNKNLIKKEINETLDILSEKCSELLGKFFEEGGSLFFEKDENVKMINDNLTEIKTYMSDIKTTLDSAVYGHNKAKKQIERIVGQWINGQQDGYCFGFEGPPGCGKTSLAKHGLAKCLKDENGVSRPFAMIQMGGDSNGSTLHGHNYTYVGSTWGSIVQILIDNKCMNPIIFIDELDKISRTEHGREIVGILTHLLDSTQNDCFQDKYFTGIDLDLSKALFILSYNDVEAVDKILLDRIHRIKFTNLSLEDKIVISKTHMLPDIYKKMGLEDTIIINDEVLNLIIEEYTSEPGVRKLKELLFELVADINLLTLKETNFSCSLPIYISKEDIKNKYFKEKSEIKQKKIHDECRIGCINGMWANSMGQGGIIPIQVKYYPSEEFLNLKLTGMQGDVMKESMNVSLTLAWDLTLKEKKLHIKNENFEVLNGVHIHCPEGSVPKDGPSAGAAITSAIFSLFNEKKIRNDVAITGEISLDGKITEIGGLDLKFLGGIKAGVKEFIYPKDNTSDFESFMEKYKNSKIISEIKFIPVTNIEEVFEIIFEK